MFYEKYKNLTSSEVQENEIVSNIIRSIKDSFVYGSCSSLEAVFYQWLRIAKPKEFQILDNNRDYIFTRASEEGQKAINSLGIRHSTLEAAAVEEYSMASDPFNQGVNDKDFDFSTLAANDIKNGFKATIITRHSHKQRGGKSDKLITFKKFTNPKTLFQEFINFCLS